MSREHEARTRADFPCRPVGGAPDTWFLDAGNTLVGMDWAQVAGELERLGYALDPGALARAEAAARPDFSRAVAGRSTEAQDSFELYARLWLERVGPEALEASRRPSAEPRPPADLARALVPALKTPGRADRLWNVALPGAHEALERLAAAGSARVVVSNSDGSVERSLVRAGLRELVDHVVDSHLVGSEKPDPAIFERALALSGARRESTLHVGDMYAADVLGARAAGIAACLLDPFGEWVAGGELDCPTAPDLRALVARTLG